MMQGELLFFELDDEALAPETISGSDWLLQHKIWGSLPVSMPLYFMSCVQ